MDRREVLEIIDEAARIGATELSLHRPDIVELPPEIGRLTALQRLSLCGTQISALPPEIGRLSALQWLDLSGTQISALPPEIGRLTTLRNLYLNATPIRVLPPEIGLLTALQELDLSLTKISVLPSEIGQLTALQELDLSDTQISALPPEIGRLTALRHLVLPGTQISGLPPEIGQLAALEWLDLSGTQISALPPEIGQLQHLQPVHLTDPPDLHTWSAGGLFLNDAPIRFPPPEVVAAGTGAIGAYFDDLDKGSERQWWSKVLIVGQPGVGKTMLRKHLCGEDVETHEGSTPGIEVKDLPLAHPSEAATMVLSAWDFGGQEIYHATHQFFLSARSLFLLVWNARTEADESRLDYWLDTIRARAPDAPVILVATHTDVRPEDIAFRELAAKYPQLVGHCAISNTTGNGIKALRDLVARAAAELPLMGQPWPHTWSAARRSILDIGKTYIPPHDLWTAMAGAGVAEPHRRVLAQWLHDLGDILYFADDEELSDIVILDRDWATRQIYRVLDDPEVLRAAGILNPDRVDALWSDLDAGVRRRLLRLMERFDLSYRTAEDSVRSLVVERLPLDPPRYEPDWDAKREEPECREVAMRFRLSVVPPGIPSWFIARSHRFATGVHWRNGATRLSGDDQCLALVRADKAEKDIYLTVRGPHPQEFFALMRDGLELTLRRYAGLGIDRFIPCPGHGGGPCPYEFNLTNVEARLDPEFPKTTIECGASGRDVNVADLLYGWHVSGGSAATRRLEELVGEVRDEVRRGFEIVAFREEQKIKTTHPSLFVLWPGGDRYWAGGALGLRFAMRLCCEQPGEWHVIESGQPYWIDVPADWMEKVEPFVRRTLKVLKIAAPFVAPGLGIAADAAAESLRNEIKLMETIVKTLPETERTRRVDAEFGRMSRMEGADLRAFQAVLDEKDPDGRYQGLERVLTPEGHYFWLCPHHARAYKR